MSHPHRAEKLTCTENRHACKSYNKQHTGRSGGNLKENQAKEKGDTNHRRQQTNSKAGRHCIRHRASTLLCIPGCLSCRRNGYFLSISYTNTRIFSSVDGLLSCLIQPLSSLLRCIVNIHRLGLREEVMPGLPGSLFDIKQFVSLRARVLLMVYLDSSS